MGWVGMATSVMMYIFYFPQIQNNLAGHKGTFIQPFMAGINCTFGLPTVCLRKSATSRLQLPILRV